MDLPLYFYYYIKYRLVSYISQLIKVIPIFNVSARRKSSILQMLLLEEIIELLYLTLSKD